METVGHLGGNAYSGDQAVKRARKGGLLESTQLLRLFSRLGVTTAEPRFMEHSLAIA